MGTRSEIRFYEGKELKGCVYHHYDGYPEHIIDDISKLKKSDAKKTMSRLSKSHGSRLTKCAHGDKSEKHQGDVEYSYKVNFNKSQKPNKIKIFHHTGFKIRKKRKVFDGTLVQARRKFR